MIVWRLAFVLCLLLVSAHAEDAPGDKPGSAAPAASDPASQPGSAAADSGPSDSGKKTDAQSSDSICLMVESAARAHGLPVEFFARVIWQESRFQPDSVGPPTRNGERAQGIAQFMPGTAAERRLLDPFDPVQALPKSAEFLRELREEFGNWGLAAAAYNAGPQRVRDFLAGSRGLPAETRHYVSAITGRSVDDWVANRPDDRIVGTDPGSSNCRTLIALLKRTPNRFVDELERRVRVGAMLPWGVQLNAGFSRAKVLSAYATLEKRFGTVLAGRDPVILSTMLRSRGTRAFYQVRVGAPTRTGADDLCSRIQRAGGACMVLRNGRGAG
ncbi:MAG TPA: lytic transglycosylase domain-containing protein [Xanthobacteraceae bacterium]|nr:lytic transglycosylase domain-containing protein [Xanthobacteraceae bacterium]